MTVPWELKYNSTASSSFSPAAYAAQDMIRDKLKGQAALEAGLVGVHSRLELRTAANLEGERLKNYLKKVLRSCSRRASNCYKVVQVFGVLAGIHLHRSIFLKKLAATFAVLQLNGSTVSLSS